jgi:hypothetical protein
MGVALVAAAVAAMGGCTPKAPAVASAVVEDKVYPVTPEAIAVKAGVITGDLTELKVTERVEQGSGRVDTPARLTGKLTLKNASADQTVRMIGGKIRYIDNTGAEIKLEDNRAEAVVKLSGYGAAERLDPGQDVSQAVSVEFPAEGLKAKKLKEIRLELTFMPAAYKLETATLAVAIGAK